jgi:transcriptional regulator with XRE-family HTH domain
VTRDHRGDPTLPPGPARDLVDLFKQLRHANPLSVGQIAVKSGLSPGHISDVLRGWKAPSPGTAAKLAKALGANDDTTRKALRLAGDLTELNRHNRKRMRDVERSVSEQTPASTPRAALARLPVVAAGAVAVVLALLAISLYGLPLPGSSSSLVTGSVACAEGRPVVGVWIAAATGQRDSGFAHLGPARAAGVNFAAGSTVTYSYLLPHGGSYAVHVGCGGTAAHWAASDFSPLLSESTVNLRCDYPGAAVARGTEPTRGTAPRGECGGAADS